MLELNRQFVIFGNFNTISFDNIDLLTELKETYEFQTSVQPDILVGQSQSVPLKTPPLFRPVFSSLKSNVSVFFGTNRIHIEQREGEINDYQNFIEMVSKIISKIISVYDITINRLAVNGNIRIDDESTINKIFVKSFGDSSLFDASSKEWNFRIVTQAEEPDLCLVNKIISHARGNFVTPNNPAWEGLILGYDYNTSPSLNRIYTMDDIYTFYNLAEKYRSACLSIE